MRKGICLSILVLLTLALTSATFADTYTGTISEADGTLVVNKDAGSPWTGVTFSWEVGPDPSGMWRYTYTTTSSKNISFLIFETSLNFGYDDIIYDKKFEIRTFTSSQPSTRFLPDDVYGVKLDDLTGTTWTTSFLTNRFPMWGDVYFKDGGDNAAWNSGFTNPDWDPPLDTPYQDGPYKGHVLVPDTVIPEPGTMALLAVGLGGLGLKLRRRKRA